VATPRPQELTIENKVVEVVETSIVDLIQVNSGTCTGNFSANSFSSNTIGNVGAVTTDHIVANSGTLSGKVISNAIQANSGVFLTSLTISGIPVSTGAGSGITAVVQDTAPVLGGNLNGNSKDISALNSITANTGSFPISSTAGQINGNNASIAFTTTSDHLVANSGTFSGKVIGGTSQFSNGSFSSSLTISGIPVPILGAYRTYYFISGAPTASTNTPSAPRLYNSSIGFVQMADLTGCKEVRFEGVQIAAGSSSCRITCNGTIGAFSSTVGSYSSISPSGENGELSINGNTGSAYKDSGWVPLLETFRSECFLAVVTSGGNGSLDPSFSQLKITAR
jgi:hypothetical protein